MKDDYTKEFYTVDNNNRKSDIEKHMDNTPWKEIGGDDNKLEDRSKAVRRIKILAITTVSIVCMLFVLFMYVIPEFKYNKAIALMESGNFEGAYSILKEIYDYKDSDVKSVEARWLHSKEQLKDVKIGDCIKFGVYEQDNKESNGKEEIEWIVLDIIDGRALLLSKYALDSKEYSIDAYYDNWEDSALRNWLNTEFIDCAFSNEEKTKISTVTVFPDRNPPYSTNLGNATQDRLFLLSITEVNKYLKTNDLKQCKPTAYAKENGAYTFMGHCRWWLRSFGYSLGAVAHVYIDGNINEHGTRVNNEETAVRPALWIDLSKVG